jgi:uncharacterized protein YbjT (DUF2867 family)
MIVIVGATGSTGTPLVRALVAEGRRVRVVARDVERARRAVGDGPEFVTGDLERPETFGRALDGAARAYVAVGGPTGTPALVDAECSLIDAAKAAGVGLYVKVSGIDATPEGPARIQRMHGAIERHLAASGLPATVLRPSFFMQNFFGLAGAIRAGALPMPTGEHRASLIDAGDIARVAARVLTEDGHAGRTYTLTGPESLSHGDAARVLGEVLGRPVRFVDVPSEAFCQGMADAGLPRWFAELLTDVYVTVFARDGASRVTDDVRRVTGAEPRTLAAFVREHRAVFEA